MAECSLTQRTGFGPGKVGVLTFHRCINYGSYWQARRLVEGLRSLGHDAVLLDYFSRCADIAEWRVALRPTLPTPVPHKDVRQYANKARKFLDAIESLPRSEPFDLDHPEWMEEMDTVVIGSDEVWNLWHPWYAGKPAFFGQGLRARRIVAYAASFGNYSCWEGIGSPWTDFLRDFDAISVRDENTWWMLRNSSGRDYPFALDPSLLFPPTLASRPTDPYVLAYGHNFSPAFTEEIRSWARARKLPIVSLGYRNDWADIQWLDAGPEDFAQAMAHAEAVATNFFHGCVFALLNAKPFACETTEYRSIKISGLMELLGGENHLVRRGDEHKVGTLLCEEPVLLERIEELRAQSLAYLDGALAGIHA